MKSGVYLIDRPVVPTPAVNRVSHLPQVAATAAAARS